MGLFSKVREIRGTERYIRKRTEKVVEQMRDKGWACFTEKDLVPWVKEVGAQVVKLPTKLYYEKYPQPSEPSKVQVADEYWAEAEAVQAARTLREAAKFTPEE